MSEALGTLPFPRLEEQPNPLGQLSPLAGLNLTPTPVPPEHSPAAQAAKPPGTPFVTSQAPQGPSQAAVTPIWRPDNPIGTESTPNYAGWDQPSPEATARARYRGMGPSVLPAVPPDNALARALQPAPNTEYGEVLPIARDTETGALRWAMPASARSFLQGGYDLLTSPSTGVVTPEATTTLAALAAPDLLERPGDFSTLRSFGARPGTDDAAAAAAARGTGREELVGRSASAGRVGEADGGALGGAPSQAYTGKGAEGSEAGRLDNAPVVRVYEPQTPIQGAGTPTYHELDAAGGGADAFHQHIAAAKEASRYGAAVTLYDPADYGGMRLFTTPDGRAGFALHDDDIVSVFKHPGDTTKRATRSMLDIATNEGGRRLDAFDTQLPHLYSESGFRAVARLPWDDQYAPAGWRHEDFADYNDGRPDVVFMVHDPENAAPYGPGDGRLVSTYNEGVHAQRQALADIDRGRGAFRAPVHGPSENVYDTIDANFIHGRDLGPRTLNMSGITGGVDLADPAERAAIDQLKRQISGPDGYWSRPIVDTNGNVLEGQHRLEAARELGVRDVPVHMVQDVDPHGVSGDLKAAIQAAQPMRGDQAHQVAQQALEAWQDHGHPDVINDLWEHPAGYKDAWDAALQHLQEHAPAPGEEHQVSTRVPTAVGHENEGYENHNLLVGYDALKDQGTGWKSPLGRIAKVIQDKYSGTDIPGLKAGADTPVKIVERFINHVRDNISHIYDSIPDAWKGRASRWYEGANTIAHNWAEEYGYLPRQIAGVLAALSPQTDWFQNVALARRVLNIMRNDSGKVFSPQAEAQAQKFIDDMPKKLKPEKRNDPQALAAVAARQGDIAKMLDAVRGKTLDQLTDPDERAWWLRWHDEAHSPREFRVVTPEGDFGDLMRNKPRKPGEQGAPAVASWMSTKNIRKAMEILGDGSLENISRNLGDAHKVRSFFDNIISPWSKQGHTTIDTHAIAAGLLKPFGQSDWQVTHGLGNAGPGHDESGLRGLYSLFHEAYRRAAEKANVLPRQMQSVTWEGIRGIFDPVAKRGDTLPAVVNKLWSDNFRGRRNAPDTRRQIYDAADAPGGIPRAPAWHRPDG